MLGVGGMFGVTDGMVKEMERRETMRGFGPCKYEPDFGDRSAFDNSYQSTLTAKGLAIFLGTLLAVLFSLTMARLALAEEMSNLSDSSLGGGPFFVVHCESEERELCDGQIQELTPKPPMDGAECEGLDDCPPIKMEVWTCCKGERM